MYVCIHIDQLNEELRPWVVKWGYPFGAICEEVTLAVLHCVDQWDALFHRVNLVRHSQDHILTEHPWVTRTLLADW